MADHSVHRLGGYSVGLWATQKEPHLALRWADQKVQQMVYHWVDLKVALMAQQKVGYWDRH